MPGVFIKIASQLADKLDMRTFQIFVLGVLFLGCFSAYSKLNPHSQAHSISDSKNQFASTTLKNAMNKNEDPALFKEDSQNLFRNGRIDKQVDYSKEIVVYYKNKCSVGPGRFPSQECNRGAVLTNIRSVIFDYAHGRGEFENKSR